MRQTGSAGPGKVVRESRVPCVRASRCYVRSAFDGSMAIDLLAFEFAGDPGRSFEEKLLEAKNIRTAASCSSGKGPGGRSSVSAEQDKAVA